MLKVCFAKQQIVCLHIIAATKLFLLSVSVGVLQTHQQHVSWRRHLGPYTFDLDPADRESNTGLFLGKDQLAWPQGRRVQIDTSPLLLRHICQTEASPAARDRCWWSKLFSGDLRRLCKAPNLFVRMEVSKAAG